jgi:Protein of unknown function (DUF3025)
VNLSSPIFRTVQPALDRFGNCASVPSVQDIDTALFPLTGIHFRVPALSTPVAYNDAIVQGVVPTREGHPHDFMNALVWAMFPAAKRALHARQARCIHRRNAKGNRSAEEDTLAILDEGGVLYVNGAYMVFGHAIYEAMALGSEVVRPRYLALEKTSEVDLALAEVLRDASRLVHKNELKLVLDWTPQGSTG